MCRKMIWKAYDKWCFIKLVLTMTDHIIGNRTGNISSVFIYTWWCRSFPAQALKLCSAAMGSLFSAFNPQEIEKPQDIYEEVGLHIMGWNHHIRTSSERKSLGGLRVSVQRLRLVKAIRRSSKIPHRSLEWESINGHVSPIRRQSQRK